ncbi:MAG: zinc dependent phospholipase C family protein [Wujia sp.]
MRKKSHISLAKGIISGLDCENRITHRVSFYIGSIWPDCIPSFITKRHNIVETFDEFDKRMKRFVVKYNQKKDLGMMSTFRMGTVMHYIADYFTYPHNAHFQGNLKEHCSYEEELKYAMYSFVDSIRDRNEAFKVQLLDSIEQIKTYIVKKHDEYVSLGTGECAMDCRYSLEACMSVFSSLLSIVAVNGAAA